MTAQAIGANKVANDKTGEAPTTFSGTAIDSSSAVATVIEASQGLFTDGAKLLSLRNAGVEIGSIKLVGGAWTGTGALASTANLPSIVSFGADPTGFTFSDDAINDAMAAHTAIYFPEGVFAISKPILVTGQGKRLVGSGSSSTEITPVQGSVPGTTWGGPRFLLTSNSPSDSLTYGGNGVVGAPGGSFPKYINLMDTAVSSFNLAGSFCVEFFQTVDSTDAGPLGSYSWIIGCIAKNYPSQAESGCWHIRQFRDGGGARFWRFAITLQSGESIGALSPITTNVKTHIALSYDITTGIARAFVAGVLVSTFGSGIPGDKPVMTPFEGCYFGDAIPVTSYNGPGQLQGTKGSMGGLRISNIPVYTAAFTPPTINPTITNNTLYLNNFDETHGPLTVGQGHVIGLSSIVKYYHLPRGTPGGAIGGCWITGMFFRGGQPCIYWSGIEGATDDLFSLGCLNGMDFYQDSFLHQSSRCNWVVSGDANTNGWGAKSGLAFTGSSTGVSTFSTINITGGCLPLFIYGGGPKFNNLIITPDARAVYLISSFLGSGLDHLSCEQTGFDIENPTDSLQAAILLAGTSQCTFTGSTLFSLPISGAAAPPIFQTFSANAPSNPDTLTIRTSMLAANTGATLIEQLGVGAGQSSILVEQCKTQGSGLVLSNIMDNIVIIGGTFGGLGHIIQGTP